MYHYSNISKQRLQTCDHRLQEIFLRILRYRDHTILEGHRSPNRQLQLYKEGKSKVKFGKHNNFPSLAVDVVPYPIKWDQWENWKQRGELYQFAGMVIAEANHLGYGDKIRWGGDWDRDYDFTDNTFDDLVHFELIS